MRKMLTVVLAVVLVMTMGTTAFAAMTDDPTSMDVVVNVQIPEGDVYAVKITWESLEFTYSFGDWNTEKLTYDAGSWNDTDAKITVSNSSNVAISVKGAVGAGTATVSGVSATLENPAFDLAVGTPNGTAPAGTMTVKIGGAPANAEAVANQIIGKVTVTLEKKQ